MKKAYFLMGLCVVLILNGAAFAKDPEEIPIFKLDMNNGVFTPSRIEVPAKKIIKLEITNSGQSPAEFESIALRKEKVIAPGATTFIVFKKIPAGEYVFFDDFKSRKIKGTIVAVDSKIH